MFSKRLMILLVVVIAACSVLTAPMNAAYAGGGGGFLKFTYASSSCQQGYFTFTGLPTMPELRGGGGSANAVVRALDSQGNPLGTMFFSIFGLGPYTGTITYSQMPVGGHVTFELAWLAGAGKGGGGVLQDTITVPVICLAGCDVLTPISSTAVMGRFVADTPLYWAPGQLISPTLTVTAGKTYLVTGQDASGMYAQILLQCTFVWVPIKTIGPDPEPLWGGRALPTGVVN